jgi:hypothetical protein
MWMLLALMLSQQPAEIDLLPPPDFKGWTRIGIPPSLPLSPASPWSVRGDVLHCAGDKAGHELLRYDRELGDFDLSVEWRLAQREGSPRYNSGILVRNTKEGDLWHQAQIGAPDNAGFFFYVTLIDGAMKRVTLKDQRKPVEIRAPGEWNRYRIRAEGCRLTLEVNGQAASELDDCAIRRGWLGFEAEGYEIEFRKLLLRER